MPDADLAAALRALGNLYFIRLIERRHLDFRAQRRLGDVDRNGAMQILLAPLEKRVLPHFQEYIKVARRSAVGAGLSLVGQTNARALIHACGNGNFQLAVHLPVSLPAALAARIANNLARAVTSAAGPADGKKTLLI